VAENSDDDDQPFVRREREKIVLGRPRVFPRSAPERDFYRSVDDQLRLYPNGSLAAHVLGFVGTENGSNRVSQTVGRDGVELVLNSALSGVAAGA